MEPITSGTSADIVFEGAEPNSHRRAMIYHVAGRQVILSQTTPPVLKDQIGKRLLVTYLERDEKGKSRYGFWAKLTRLLADYELASQRLPALVLQVQTDPKLYNFRMSYRIKPLSNRGLAAHFDGEVVTILDISVGGIRIITGTDRSINLNDTVTLTIQIDDKKFDVNGMVIKVSQSSMPGAGPGQRQVAIQFTSHEKEREKVLGEKIFRLDRERLAQGMR
jgi:hypothetical protein